MKKRRSELTLFIILVCLSMVGGCQLGSTTGQKEQPDATPSPVFESPISSSPVGTPELSTLNSPIKQSPPQPTPTFPKPAADKAAVRGALIVSSSNQPLPETLVYLVPAIMMDKGTPLPPSALAGPQKNDASGFTDKQGWFALNDVPPGNYYLAVWAPLNWLILSKPNESGSEVPLSMELKAHQVVDLGEMTIQWP